MPQPTEVILYTRAGCHLCEAAKELLSRYNLPVREVDIDRDPTLHNLYDQCVPVVVLDGKERFRGRLDERLLRRLLRS